MAIASPWTSGDGACDAAAGSEVISGGRSSARRPVTHRLAATIAVAALLGGGLWLTNRRIAGREAAAVFRCVQTSQQTLANVDGQLAATAKYVAPQVGPQSSLLIRDSLYRLIEDSASSALPALEGAISGCDQVAIAPPYHRLSAARAAYVVYLDAELAHLQDITRDGTAQARVPPELAPLRATARTALLAAEPGASGRARVAAALPLG